MKRPVTIYAEMTPNPNTMKFVADHMLVESGVVVEFLNSNEAKGYSTFAEALFNFPFVQLSNVPYFSFVQLYLLLFPIFYISLFFAPKNPNFSVYLSQNLWRTKRRKKKKDQTRCQNRAQVWYAQGATNPFGPPHSDLVVTEWDWRLSW